MEVVKPDVTDDNLMYTDSVFMSLGKILLLTFIVLLVGVAWILLERTPKVTNYPTAGTNIIVFGDSIAAGEGTTLGNDFASLLEERLDISIRNISVPGNMTQDGLQRINEVLESDPRVVIVLFGGNDALRRVPVEQTFQNLALIIEQIQKVGAAVLLVGEPGGLYGKQYPKGYEKLAREYGVAYVPNVLHGLIGRPAYMSDAIHPNDAGHVLIADRIEPLLQNLLEHN